MKNTDNTEVRISKIYNKVLESLPLESHSGKEISISQKLDVIESCLDSLIKETADHKSIIENEKKLRDIASVVPTIIYQYEIDSNHNLNFTFVSDAIFNLWGIPPEEVYKNPSLLFSKIHCDDIYKFREAITYSNTHLTKLSQTIRITNGEEVFKWLRIDSIPVKKQDGTIIRNGSIIDITVEKKIDEELKKSELRLNEAQRIAHIGSWELDLVNNILSWSDENYEIFEQKKTEFGASYEAFLSTIHPEDRENLDKIYINSVATKTPYEITHRLLFPDGRIKHVYERCETHYDLNGKPIRSVGTTQDVTGKIKAENDLKLKEEQLTKLVHELNNKYNELMQFNYIISHNLRAPVANLLGISNIINSTEIKNNEKEILLKNIEVSAKKMDEILKDLSSILGTKSSLNAKKETFDLNKLLEGIFYTLQKEIKEANINIKTNISADSEKLHSIKSYIESIMYNLISNAIKYKSPLRNPELTIAICKQGDNTNIIIEDNGIGIDLDKNKDQLFGLYKRFNFEVEGKGLGLHMTKTQIETLGGAINAESSLDKGTKFNIILPT